MSDLHARIQGAWQGRISGCQLGKPVEVLSMTQGHAALTAYLEHAGALPLRDYIPLVEGTIVDQLGRASCRGFIERSEPDDDLNYTVVALLLLEEHGVALRTVDVARAWLRLLPAGATFTAERAAYRTLLDRAHDWFVFGAEPGFDLAECVDSAYQEWIGAQIRADLYGWVCPGRPALAADLARRDAALSHRGDGVHGAAFVAALGSAIPAATSLQTAVDTALVQIPVDSAAADAVRLGRACAGTAEGARAIRERYIRLSPLHTVNNLALVVWALLSYPDDFGAAIGEVVAAGLDTDCNGATVGGLWGLQGKPIPESWTRPWRGRVAVSLAGFSELSLDELVDRTRTVAKRLAREG
ncbi:MAG: ADP-ribosylglycohydrolase family protein [Candidatus Binatia bacterium]